MRPRLGTVVLLLSLVVVVACGNKKKQQPSGPPPEVTGLAAVPATAQVLIAADVRKLAGSPIIERAVAQLLLREPSLVASWEQVRDGCKLDLPEQVGHIMLAVGPAPAGAVGTGPVLMVATGTLSEPDLASCMRMLVGKGGGSLTVKTVAGRSVYQVQDGGRSMNFAFSRPDTIVLGTSESWVVEALGTGPKAVDNPELTSWLELVDRRTPLWAVGRVDERLRQGLVGSSRGKLTAGPTALVASLDPSSGATLALGAVMATDQDAKGLESFAETELKVIWMAAQLKSLGSVVSRIGVDTDGKVVWFRAPLTMEEVNQLLSVLDEKPVSEQGSPPAK